MKINLKIMNEAWIDEEDSTCCGNLCLHLKEVANSKKYSKCKVFNEWVHISGYNNKKYHRCTKCFMAEMSFKNS